MVGLIRWMTSARFVWVWLCLASHPLILAHYLPQILSPYPWPCRIMQHDEGQKSHCRTSGIIQSSPIADMAMIRYLRTVRYERKSYSVYVDQRFEVDDTYVTCLVLLLTLALLSVSFSYRQVFISGRC
jgi:hypothetical protein